MPRNAGGTYSAPAGTAAVAGQKVRSTQFNGFVDDAGAEITKSADRSKNLSDLNDAAAARANIGLSNVNNTSDADKPISTATTAALATKADAAATTAALATKADAAATTAALATHVRHDAAQTLTVAQQAQARSNIAALGADQAAKNITDFPLNQSVASGANVTFGETYTDKWFRVTPGAGNNNSGGIYWETYGGGWTMTDNVYVRSYGNKPILVGSGSRFGDGAACTITLTDDESPNGVKHIHANANLVGFLGGDGGWRLYVREDGLVWASGYGWLHDRFADRGAQVQRASGVAEFGTVYLDTSSSADLPAPWVLVGLRTSPSNPSSGNAAPQLILRGSLLRNN